jgi:predicted Zn-dependent peptidase
MVKKFVLENGTTVLIDRMQDVRSFALGFFVGTGSGDEPAARQGISHFLEHVLFKRTRRRSTVRIAREIDRLGGDVDAFTTKEYTGFYVHTLDARFSEALDLMGDLVLSPAFDAVDIEVERGVILEELGEANDNPDDLVHEMFVRSFWRSHPLGAPILGSAETVRSIGLADLYRYYRSRYTPENLIVSVAGHVRVRECLSEIEKLFRRRASRIAPPRSGGKRPTRPRGHQDLLLESKAPRRLPRGVSRSTCSISCSAAACLRASSRRCGRSAASLIRSRRRSTPSGWAVTRRSTPPAPPRTSRDCSR